MLALIGNISYSVFRKEGEFLKVEEDVFSYSVKEMKGHDDVIPCIRERCFDYVFSNNNKFIALFLNEVLSLDSVINASDIVKLSNNMEVKHKKDKYHRLDFVYKIDKLKLNIDSNFDINFLIESMPKQVDKKIFTKDMQELIISLAFLYDIDVSHMANIIKSCINERGTVNRDEVRKVARDHYQFDHSGLLPTVIEQTQPEYLRKPIGDTSRMAKMIYTFETVSPYDFLRSKCGDAEPVKRDLKLLEDLIIDYKLKPGVVNVLIDYVLKTNDNKLTKSLVETIAGQWMRKKIETVEDAMEIARKNHQMNIRSQSIKKNVNNKNSNTVPVWFDKDINKEVATDEEREAIEEMLKEYR